MACVATAVIQTVAVQDFGARMARAISSRIQGGGCNRALAVLYEVFNGGLSLAAW